MTARIDAHHHVWRVARGDYGWLTPDLPICRDYGLDDLRPHLAETGITGTVLVQAAPTEAETDFMLAAMDASGGLVRGVVGWVPFDAPDRVAARLADPRIVGIRPMLHDLTDETWILWPEHAAALRAVAASGKAFDALVRPVHLHTIGMLADRRPDLRIVIDHCAKPAIRDGMWEPWASGLADLAERPNIFCKLSGLLTEAGGRDVARHARHVLDCFGAGRVMFGSDWPVLELAGRYVDWFAAVDALLDPAARTAVLGGTAIRFYRLGQYGEETT